MILTNCAACAAPLERLAKQCSRCKTRYCNEACQAPAPPPAPARRQSARLLALGAGASQDLGAVVAETCDAWLRDSGSRRDVEAYWATLRDASAHGHAAGNAAARDVHSKAGFVLALCDAFRRVDESRE